MHRLLIDTNVLLLLIVGTMNRQLISAHRRTRKFTPADFDLLLSESRRYARTLLTTQPILTETSNLLGNDFHIAIAPTLFDLYADMLEVIRPKEVILQQAGFNRLGFADSSILAALENGIVVLTDDVHLYNQVLVLGYQAINFNHLRSSR